MMEKGIIIHQYIRKTDTLYRIKRVKLRFSQVIELCFAFLDSQQVTAIAIIYRTLKSYIFYASPPEKNDFTDANHYYLLEDIKGDPPQQRFVRWSYSQDP